MKILMLLFTGRDEGTFYRAFPWARYLVGEGHQVTIICTSSSNRFHQSVAMEQGVHIIETPCWLTGRNLMARLSGMYGWGPLDIAARVRELRHGKYDVVHTFEHHLHVALPVYLAGRKHIPVLVADWCDHYGKGGLRGYEYSPYRLRRLYKWAGFPLQMLMDCLEGALRRRADAVTVISTWLRQRAINVGVPKEKIHLIPGSSDTEKIHPSPTLSARKKLGLNENLHYALFFGAGQLDVDFSLEAFAQVVQEIPDTRFIVLGKESPDTTRKILEYGLQDKVIQTGWISDDQLNGWLASTDICLLPMKDHIVNHARWPNKIGFYMAAAKPTVATRVNDASQLIETKDIGMVSKVDPSDFASQIIYLFTHKQQAVEKGERARRIAEQEYTVEIHGSQLEELYEDLIKVKHG